MQFKLDLTRRPEHRGSIRLLLLAAASLTLASASNAAITLKLESPSDTGLQRLQVTGPENSILEVQASDDLKNWFTVGIGQVQQGSFQVEDAASALERLRFYRAIGVNINTGTNTPPPPASFQVTAGQGLQALVSGGSLTATNGAAFTVSDQTVTLLPNRVNYLVLDLFDGLIHVLPRAIHSGGIEVGEVTTSGQGISGIVQKSVAGLPASRVAKTKQKLAAGQPVEVLLMGDWTSSASTPTSPDHRWFNLLFSTNAYTNTWQAIANDPSVIIENYAADGANARYGLTALGFVTAPNAYGAAEDQVNEALFRTLYNDQHGPPPQWAHNSFLESPVPDLVIIGFGASSTSDEAIFLETTIREFREAGAEVILQTENAGNGLTTPLLEDGKTLSEIADTQACALADTWAYMHEASDSGKNVYRDPIRPNDLGNTIWAGSIRSVINDLAQSADSAAPSGGRATLSQAGAETNRFPNSVIAEYQPNATTGTRIASTSNLGLPILLGGLSAANPVIQLTTNQYATYACSRVLAVDAIIENQPGEDGTIELSTNFRNDVFKTVNLTGSGVPWQQVTLLDVDEVPGLSAFSFYPGDWTTPAATLGLRITCTSGTAKIAGIIFHTFKGTDIPFESMNFSGNWNTEFGGLDATMVEYAATNNNSVTIPFTGNGIEVMLNGGSTAGIVSVSVDGTVVDPALDLYANVGDASLLYSLKLFPGNLDYSKAISSNYGAHSVQITLVGANPAAGPSAPARRSLSIYGAQALDAR